MTPNLLAKYMPTGLNVSLDNLAIHSKYYCTVKTTGATITYEHDYVSIIKPIHFDYWRKVKQLEENDLIGQCESQMMQKVCLPAQVTQVCQCFASHWTLQRPKIPAYL